MDMSSFDHATFRHESSEVQDDILEELIADVVAEAASAPYDDRLSHHGSLIDFLPAEAGASPTWALRFKGSVRAIYPDLESALDANKHTPIRGEALRAALRHLAGLAHHRVLDETNPIVALSAAAATTRPSARAALTL